MKITVYEDPKHAWGKVPKKKLEELGILDQITSFSYERNGYLYLEEDCDLPLFIEAMEDHGETVEIENQVINHQSRIQSYKNWNPKK